jgi:hypothetical protein
LRMKRFPESARLAVMCPRMAVNAGEPAGADGICMK